MRQSILITGASSGIGKALSFELAHRGYPLALAARRLDVLEKLRTAIKTRHPAFPVKIRKLNVTCHDKIGPAINELVTALGEADIVFANTDIGLEQKIGDSMFDNARPTIETNLIGAMATVDAAMAYFLQQGKGHIVGTCSVAAFRGLPRNASYSASKAGLAVYLEAVRAEKCSAKISTSPFYIPALSTPLLNQMLPKRPFLISAEKGAAIIARLIEKR
jgi:short-subunit dehydrogenase